MKPVCVPCERFMRPKQNGFSLIEGMPTRNGALPGKAEPDAWVPYKLWRADLWWCPDCGTQIVIGAAMRPLAEHYQPNFDAEVAAMRATLLVKDC